MKKKDIENVTGDIIEDVGIDTDRKVVFGDTKDIGGDACKKIFGDGIVGSAGSMAVNILTGGALSLLKWVGPAEEVGKALGNKIKSKKNKKWRKWEQRHDELDNLFVEAVKEREKNLSVSDRKRLENKVDCALKKLHRHVDKMPI